MKVFVTGAGGFIGQATIKELIAHGHEVLGMVRSDASADTVSKLGATPFRGDLQDVDSLARGAQQADGVIHLAFVHDFDKHDFAESCAIDRAAIQAMGDVLAGTGKPLIIASGTLMAVKDGRLADEDTPADRDPQNGLNARAESADLVERFSKEHNVRGMVVRLCPTVHGAGDKGFMHMFIEGAKKSGRARYIDDGTARWPAVHRDDTAVLFRLALEKGRAGSTYNAVAEQGVPMRDIWSLIGRRLGLPVEGAKSNELLASMGFMALVMGLDNPSSGAKTQRELGWQPKEIGLLQDLEANYLN